MFIGWISRPSLPRARSKGSGNPSILRYAPGYFPALGKIRARNAPANLKSLKGSNQTTVRLSRTGILILRP